jgi:hypothetical protein
VTSDSDDDDDDDNDLNKRRCDEDSIHCEAGTEHYQLCGYRGDGCSVMKTVFTVRQGLSTISFVAIVGMAVV